MEDAQPTANELDLQIQKTNRELRINIRHEDDSTSGGLFIHGFQPNSRAREQGIVRVGDEVIAIDNLSVRNKDLAAIAKILRKHRGDVIKIRVRRMVD